jgi:hypothetical protein
MGTPPDTCTFTRAEINSIVEQFKAINLNGAPIFTVHQEDGLRGVSVQLKTCLGWDTTWLYFLLDPSEPETEPARRARECML